MKWRSLAILVIFLVPFVALADEDEDEEETPEESGKLPALGLNDSSSNCGT